jgi:uncharacterized membrane protein YccC
MPLSPAFVAVDLRAWASRRRAELRLAVRIAVAAVTAYGLAEALALTPGYWAVFTSVIVVQASVGGSLKATVERLIGTLGGGAYGGVIALVIAGGNDYWRAAALALAVLPLAVIAAVDERFRIAPITAVIVLLSQTGQTQSPILFIIDRIGEIMLGSIVALAVSLFVLPARAHNILTTTTGRLLFLFADFFTLILDGLSGLPVDGTEIRRLQIASRRTLAQLETIAEEAKHEQSSRLTDDPDPDPVVRTSHRMRNDLIMLARAAITPLSEPVAAKLHPALNGLAAAGGAWLRQLSDAFTTRGPPPSLEHFDTALRVYRQEVAALRQEGTFRAFSAEAVGRIFALGFALEQLRENASDLADRATEFAQPAITAAARV